MLVKWYQIETTTGVKKVQGLGEKFVAESLNRFGIKWDRPKAIKTPFGNYTPDFWCESAGVFIEVKGSTQTIEILFYYPICENIMNLANTKTDTVQKTMPVENFLYAGSEPLPSKHILKILLLFCPCLSAHICRHNGSKAIFPINTRLAHPTRGIFL